MKLRLQFQLATSYGQTRRMVYSLTKDIHTPAGFTPTSGDTIDGVSVQSVSWHTRGRNLIPVVNLEPRTQRLAKIKQDVEQYVSEGWRATLLYDEKTSVFP